MLTPAMLSLSRERVKRGFQGRRHRRNSVGWSRGSWETKDTDRASDSEAQRSGSQFSKQIFRHFCHWCLKKETNITIESFHISQISFFRPPFWRSWIMWRLQTSPVFFGVSVEKWKQGKSFSKFHIFALSLFFLRLFALLPSSWWDALLSLRLGATLRSKQL